MWRRSRPFWNRSQRNLELMSDIPDLTDVTAVVTGASSGIGLEVAPGLASKGAHVVLAVRSSRRGQAAASAIRASRAGASLEVRSLDLADLASVHRFADELRSQVDALALLINVASCSALLQVRRRGESGSPRVVGSTIH